MRKNKSESKVHSTFLCAADGILIYTVEMAACTPELSGSLKLVQTQANNRFQLSQEQPKVPLHFITLDGSVGCLRSNFELSFLYIFWSVRFFVDFLKLPQKNPVKTYRFLVVFLSVGYEKLSVVCTHTALHNLLSHRWLAFSVVQWIVSQPFISFFVVRQVQLGRFFLLFLTALSAR